MIIRELKLSSFMKLGKCIKLILCKKISLRKEIVIMRKSAGTFTKCFKKQVQVACEFLAPL